MATGFSGLGLGELGAESKYVGKSDTFYMPPEVKNEKGEVQDSMLTGLRKMAGKYLGDKYVTPGVNWLENKFSPVPPPNVAPMAVAPVVPTAAVAPGSVVSAPVDANADHPALEGLLKTSPFLP